MRQGSQEIGRRVGARVTGIVFAVCYLWATLSGANGITALQRAVLGGFAALIMSQLLCPPLVGAVLDALARDQARRRAELAKAAEEDR